MDGLHTLRHPRADRIVPSRQVMRVVRVQALDLPPRSAHAAPGSRLPHRAPPVERVRRVGAGQSLEELGVRTGSFRQTRDPALGLQSGHGLHRVEGLVLVRRLLFGSNLARVVGRELTCDASAP